METEERARLENDAITNRLRLAIDGRKKESKTGEDDSYRTAHVSLIKVVDNVGVVCPSNPF